MFMKHNVCIKFVDASDDTLFTSVLSDAKVVKNVSGRIIKEARERLDEEFIGSIGENLKENTGCENKKIYVLKIKIDSIENETAFNPAPFGSVSRNVVKIKYIYVLKNDSDREMFRNKTDDTDPNLSDLTEEIGENIAKKIIEFNYSEQ